eukprot:TRINITY_DN2287_c0_g2_i1.p1 TRINITY_DN2287_c0_g2~~TRINITY_DN2287_c0_g2_i1.p1  ORF type:complete len:245 (-),score=63.31 TRINITY_DN2287_c0_g2_i1:95-769(-)
MCIRDRYYARQFRIAKADESMIDELKRWIHLRKGQTFDQKGSNGKENPSRDTPTEIMSGRTDKRKTGHSSTASIDSLKNICPNKENVKGTMNVPRSQSIQRGCFSELNFIPTLKEGSTQRSSQASSFKRLDFQNEEEQKGVSKNTAQFLEQFSQIRNRLDFKNSANFENFLKELSLSNSEFGNRCRINRVANTNTLIHNLSGDISKEENSKSVRRRQTMHPLEK